MLVRIKRGKKQKNATGNKVKNAKGNKVKNANGYPEKIDLFFN